MTARHHIAWALASAAVESRLRGQPLEPMLRGAVEGLVPTAIKALAKKLDELPQLPPLEELARLIDARDELFPVPSDRRRAPRPPFVRHWYSPADLAMGQSAFQVPAIATAGELAVWCQVTPGELYWLADPRGINRGQLAHYIPRWVPKRRGGRRLIEVPKRRLKAIQRRALHGLLNMVSPHTAARGLSRGQSIHHHVAEHVAQRWVLHLDIADFFPHVGAARVRALFAALGYPPEVARLLTGLCTTSTASSTLRSADAAESALLGQRHLPQGAPTSPAIANLAAWPLDVRLSALAKSLNLKYTRYADDLALSGPKISDDVIARVAAIAIEERFPLQLRKTRRMGSGQRQMLGGLVINHHAQASRQEYDRLRAILFRAARNGLAAENRDDHPDFRAHLRGRIEWVATGSPTRRRKLLSLLHAIE